MEGTTQQNGPNAIELWLWKWSLFLLLKKQIISFLHDESVASDAAASDKFVRNGVCVKFLAKAFVYVKKRHMV